MRTDSSAFQIPGHTAAPQRRMVVWDRVMPRSAIIWTRSRELSLNVRYHRMHRTMISWSKCRPLKRSCAEVGTVIPAVIARPRAFQQFAPEPASRAIPASPRQGWNSNLLKKPKSDSIRTSTGKISLSGRRPHLPLPAETGKTERHQNGVRAFDWAPPMMTLADNGGWLFAPRRDDHCSLFPRQAMPVITVDRDEPPGSGTS